MVKIYTKTGDKGETSLLGGKRKSKNCVELRVVGELDELNSVLGIVLCYIEDEAVKNTLDKVQKDIIKVSSEIASLQSPLFEKIEKLGKNGIIEIERQIDKWWARLPELKSFILPGGNLAGAHLHLARVVCRRAERELVNLGKQKKVRSELYAYLNRLSDFLFAGARWTNHQSGIEDLDI